MQKLTESSRSYGIISRRSKNTESEFNGKMANEEKEQPFKEFDKISNKTDTRKSIYVPNPVDTRSNFRISEPSLDLSADEKVFTYLMVQHARSSAFLEQLLLLASLYSYHMA